jgi:bifunctional DNase/RNase
MLVEMVVESVRVNLQTYHRVVVLKEKESDRHLPIWIGNNEADAIVIQLQNVPVPRPQTHDLLKAVITELGAKVSRVVVSDLADDVFYARIVMDIDGRHVEVDSRPSDAIALAVRVKSPIFVEDSVLEKAGVTLTAEGEPVVEEQPKSQAPGRPPLTPEREEEERKKLSPFIDFINELPGLDDLGNQRGQK